MEIELFGKIIAMSRKLNTTAYSLLGLFHKKSWSAYDLAIFMDGSVLKYILPRTRSQIFNEPKKLTELGLLVARQEPNGNRNRTVYTITDKGRQAFSEWLQQPGEPQKTEYKSLLKFYLTQPDDPQALLKRIGEMKQHTACAIDDALQQVNDILQRGLRLKDTALAASSASQLAAREFKARLAWLDELADNVRTITASTDIEQLALSNYQQSQRQLLQLKRELAEEQPSSD